MAWGGLALLLPHRTHSRVECLRILSAQCTDTWAMQRVKTYIHLVTSALSLMVGWQSHDKETERQRRLFLVNYRLRVFSVMISLL